ncbi:MAG: tryptophan synthase subunit alpha [Thermodesulfobacteriota bacterium]
MTKKSKNISTNGAGRIEKCFKNLKDSGEKALITFVTAGDPSLKKTKEIIFEMERAGADLIELGIPFSDPMADGPTIQASSERALKKGATLAGVLSLVTEVRRTSEIPIVLFGYYNPVFVYGPKRFATDAKKAGVDGVLIVDLPPEECAELHGELKGNGLDLIFLLTPTSDARRMKLVAERASGFVYYVSLTGVTGARKKTAAKIGEAVKSVRKYTRLPVGVGFGLSTEEQVRGVCRFADGAVVGSAIIDQIAKNSKSKDMPKKVGSFVRRLKKGTRV